MVGGLEHERADQLEGAQHDGLAVLRGLRALHLALEERLQPHVEPSNRKPGVHVLLVQGQKADPDRVHRIQQVTCRSRGGVPARARGLEQAPSTRGIQRFLRGALGLIRQPPGVVHDRFEAEDDGMVRVGSANGSPLRTHLVDG